eukprot:TRINITY_DN5458_c2_g1_i1.p1 TRINITY_DN5458_c2_g1~~TRINITY_DN5458_c2_g1_i1.p1  ORF type:complete len:464 (+),score=31.42 TRINITY_DN5458_c2_g1_i1:50-1441(+)
MAARGAAVWRSDFIGAARLFAKPSLCASVSLKCLDRYSASSADQPLPTLYFSIQRCSDFPASNAGFYLPSASFNGSDRLSDCSVLRERANYTNSVKCFSRVGSDPATISSLEARENLSKASLSLVEDPFPSQSIGRDGNCDEGADSLATSPLSDAEHASVSDGKSARAIVFESKAERVSEDGELEPNGDSHTSTSRHRTWRSDSPELASETPIEPAIGEAPVKNSDRHSPGGGLKSKAPKMQLVRGNALSHLPSGTHSRVVSAVFVKSSPDISQCPRDGRPEFAVIGRSNVGKSSLINMLTSRKDLAQTSKTPGKTQLINHFNINDSWYLVDLPGYGYAKASQTRRQLWSSFTEKYFLERETLVSALLLVDATIPRQEIDVECADWFGRNQIPVTIVFTKCDKKKKAKNGGRPLVENVEDFENALSECYDDDLPPRILTSSETGMGRDALLAHIAQLRKHWST